MNRKRKTIHLGTRGSPLAMAQAHMTAAALSAQHEGLTVDIVEISTQGDRVQDRALRDIGGKALWTRELDRALLDGDIDCAVHSMKDVETFLADGIMLAAMLPRADPRDRLIGADNIADLPARAIVGTSSPRRAAQLLNRRPDIAVVMLRGNVETRLRRVADGDVAATFLAAAGLDRLKIAAGAALPLDGWLPAVAQGAVGITCRADDADMCAMLAAINDADTRLAVAAERGLLEGLGGSCHTAVAANACRQGESLVLKAELMSPDGQDLVAEAVTAAWPSAIQDARAIGLALAERLMGRATPAILRSLSGDAEA